MATPIVPSEPSTLEVISNPSSLVMLTKSTDEMKKQVSADKKYDTKGSLYDGFEDMPSGKKILSIGLSFAIAAGILLVVGGLLPKKRLR